MSLFEQLKDLLRPYLPGAQQESPRHFFTTEEVARLHQLSGRAADTLDDQTWQDLLLGDYEERLGGDASIYGRQMLHRHLRDGLGQDKVAQLRGRLQGLMDDPVRLDALHRDLLTLRYADTDVAGLLFDDEPPRAPAWGRWLWILPLALLLSLALLITQPLGWIAPLAALAPLAILQVRYHRRIEQWGGVIRSLHALLRTTTLLGQREEAFASLRDPAERLHVRFALPLLLRMIPGGAAYADWFGAANVGRYFKTARIVHAERGFLRECYVACATLEMDVALARHLLAAPRWCWAERSAARSLELEQGVHPLMAQPSPLSLALDGRGAFVSGQNASGKSTFLRMVGLNLVAARAFGFAYAHSARLPALPVRASMQNEDSLLGGESLYMAELRRARELLDASARAPGVCLIDEVFRGTNHLESVSAAAAVLEQLAARELVLVSSHNLVLAPLLREQLAPVCIDTSSGKPVLAQGVLRNPNGIALLATQGFGPLVEDRAAEVARWLSSHLAEPSAPAPQQRAA